MKQKERLFIVMIVSKSLQKMTKNNPIVYKTSTHFLKMKNALDAVEYLQN